MIAEVVRGEFMPDLISYLFGPGRFNEHTDQHLVAGYADAVFSAPARLWKSEPGTQRQVHAEARELGWEVEYPHSRWATEVANGYVWHCSMSVKAEEGQLTDSQWTEAAHAMVSALGFSGEDGKAPCRWVAVRHGLSKEGNDHIHLAVNLVREDGTKASVWNDYRKAGAVCTDLETRFGLQHVPGRESGRHLGEPSRADREISATRGEPEPLRIRLERKVRACAAAAESEAHFVALARGNGLLIRPRYADERKARVVGYAVAERGGREAYSNRTKKRGPVWFGGGKLATDLALPRLRQRWQPDPGATTVEALAAWSAVGTMTAASPPRQQRRFAAAEADTGTAADALAAAATSIEGENPGPLSQAARHMARAAHDDPAPRNPAAADAVRHMADAFLTIVFAGESETAGTLILVQEVARLADACAARATTVTARREARQASVLVNASVAALAQAADQQAVTTLTSTTRGASMSEPTHEEEALRLLTQAGVLAAQVARGRAGGSTGMAAEITRLRRAGYTEKTPYDDLLRDLLGEQRWAWYAQDKARIAAAAAITDADRAGIYDMEKLLTRAVKRRPWEDDPTNPARSVAEILHYRVKTEVARSDPSVLKQPPIPAQSRSRTDSSRTDRAGSPARLPAQDAAKPLRADEPPEPMPVTPYDARLRQLLGEERWHWYAGDQRRRTVAKLIQQATAEGRDVNALLTKAVTMRGFEKDPTSPTRRPAAVLSYRIEQLLAQPPEDAEPADLPSGVAGAVSNAAAPVGTGPKTVQQPRPGTAQDAPPPFRRNGRPPDGRDGR